MLIFSRILHQMDMVSIGGGVMEQENIRYGIAGMIWDEMVKQGLSREDMLRKMYCGNMREGLRMLNRLFRKGCINNRFTLQMCRTLGISDELIIEAYEESVEKKREMRRERDIKKFLPHLRLITALSIPACGLTAATFLRAYEEKMVMVKPELAEIPLKEQVKSVSRIIREHYRLNGGRTKYFGEITGYIWRMSYHDSFEFTINGILTGKNGDKNLNTAHWFINLYETARHLN